MNLYKNNKIGGVRIRNAQQKTKNMKTEFLDLDCFLIEFTYEHQQAEPEVGYLVPFWSWDVKAVYVASDLIFDEYDILDQLSVEDLGRIDDEIEEYLNNK